MSTRKLKMKIERLLINNNEQTEEALKHIYTALLANPDIEIRIDLPSEPVLFTNESLSEEQEEDLEEEDESPTPNHAAVAQAPLDKKQENTHEDEVDRNDSLISDDKKKLKPDEEEEELEIIEEVVVPGICKHRMCRSCR